MWAGKQQIANIVQLGWCRFEGDEDCLHLISCEGDDRGAKQECLLELVGEWSTDDARELPHQTFLDVDASQQHGSHLVSVLASE